MDDLRGDGAPGHACEGPLPGAGEEPGDGSWPLAELPTETAFRATQLERAALGAKGLARLNVDPSRAVTTVLGSLPALRALRPELLQRLPAFDLQRFDKLEQYALALQHAHVLHRGQVREVGSLAELAAEVTQERDRLLGDACSLAAHGLLERELPQLCKRSRAYLAIASDVFLLVHSFRERWPAVAGRTPVSPGQLVRAHDRAFELLTAVGERASAPEAIGETQLARQQAFTLLFKAYEAARRAVQYLRAEQGDAHELAPAFYPGRAGRRGQARKRASGHDEAAGPSGELEGGAGRLEGMVALRVPTA